MAALAHRAHQDAIEASYRRTDLFERRRALMERWAAFLAGGGKARGANGGVTPVPIGIGVPLAAATAAGAASG